MFFCKGKGKGKKGKNKHWWKGHSHCHDERTEPAVNASDDGESAAQKPCKSNWYLLTCCHVFIPIHWLLLRSGPRLEKKVATLVELQLANEEAPEQVILAFFLVPGSSTYFRIPAGYQRTFGNPWWRCYSSYSAANLLSSRLTCINHKHSEMHYLNLFN